MLHKIVDKIGNACRFLFDSDATQRVFLRSFVPKRWGLIPIIRKCWNTSEICCDSRLDTWIDPKRANVLLLVTGLGASRGFFCCHTHSLDDKCLCPVSWWQSERKYKLYIFALTCFSADYLRERDVSLNFHSAIGFADDVYFDFDSDDKNSVHFVEGLLRCLKSELSSSGKINDTAVCSIKRLLAAAAIGGHYQGNRGKTKWKGPMPSLLNSIFLAGLSDSIRFIEGRQV
ncbi:MAG: hypothetical protein V3V99_14735 [candidate division Zixibacteria bacterium]